MTIQKTPIRVVVVDDQDSIRSAAVELLSDAPDLDVVGEAADGSEGVDLVLEVEPNVVLMDMRMPILDGLAATRRLATSRSTAAILMHSAYGDESLVLEAFQAGARGYVLKGSAGSDLVTAIRNVAAGQAHISDEIARPLIAKLVQALDLERQTRVAAEAATDLLARVHAQQQEFAIQASHELRTPLTTLMGSLELLADVRDLTWEDRGSLAKAALDGAHRIVSLTEDLEVIASGELIDVNLQPVSLDLVVDEVAESLDGRGVVRRGFSRIEVIADVCRLRKVLDHLIRNAVSASPQGKAVTIEATVSGDGMVQIDIADEGSGLDPEIMEALFEPFTHKLGSPSGLGVGLAVVRTLVSLMEGEITARNNSQAGATVSLTLPRATQ